ncbi:MAG: transposase [Xanthobacteraceae bacterium]
MSKLDHMLEPEVTAVHRLEVISGTGRRRRFASDFKAQIVEETLVPGVVVSDVARRHGLTPQQVFTWRRQARQPPASSESQAPQFVPAVVETAIPSLVRRGRQRKRTGQASRNCGSIEVEIDGVTIRIGRGAEAKTVAAVLRALKAAA